MCLYAELFAIIDIIGFEIKCLNYLCSNWFLRINEEGNYKWEVVTK